MRRALTLILLLLPTLALAGWAGWLAAGRAEPGLRLDIIGYDPRDLLRGHYLVFRLDLPNDVLAAPCVCLSPEPADPSRAAAAPIACEAAALARCPLPVRNPGRPFRYYLPADRALELEALLREPGRRVSVEAHRDGDGGLAFSAIRVEE